MKKITAGFISLSLALSGCAIQAGTSKKTVGIATPPLSRSSSTQQEIDIGNQINGQILSYFYTYSDQKVVDYINKVGNALAAHAKRKDIPYHFTILYDEKIYATSAPGGYVYVTTGMLNFLDNEAELAAVLAHEIGQLQYRDPRLSNAKKILDNLSMIGANVGPAFGQIGALAVLGIIIANSAADSQIKKPSERVVECDRLALKYLVQEGYTPEALMDLFHKFLDAPEEKLPLFYDYYQARPISEYRISHLQKEFSKLKIQEGSFTTDLYEYQDIMKGVREIPK